MRIFGNNIGIIVGSSSSLATGSISLNQEIPSISFLYSAPYDDYRITGSIASIETILTSVNNTEGAAGALSFKISDPSNLNTTGSEVLRMFVTSSEPRVGIGFDKNEPISKAFEIKTKKDSTEGTEIVLENSRLTEGALVGDSAGKINFIINSGSFDNKYVSGSVASVETIVTEVTEYGVTGHLKFNLTRTNTELSRPIWSMGYSADPKNTGGFGTIYTGSFNIVGYNNTTPQVTLTNGDSDSYIQLQYLTESLNSDSTTTLDYFTTSSDYSGIEYNYTLLNPGNGARKGQFMAVWDNGVIEFTDISTPSIGNDLPPTLTAVIEGVSNDIFALKITNGNGYTFKSLVKKI